MEKQRQFSTEIIWNFNEFEPNCIRKGQHQEDEAKRRQKQKFEREQYQKKLLTQFTKHIDPFHLIDTPKNFAVIDVKKKKVKNNVLIATYNGDIIPPKGTQTKPYEKETSYSYQSAENIDFINNYLINSWTLFDKIMDSIMTKDITKDLKFTGRKELYATQLKQYLHSIKQQDQVKVQLIGHDLSHILKNKKESKAYFAISYEKGSLSNTGLKYQSKFVIFDQNNFYKVEAIYKLIQSKQNHQIKCKASIKDYDQFFRHILQDDRKCFKKFEFYANGNYIEYPLRQPIAKKRRFICGKSYSLVLQGGGAKGVAYVGSYKAIRQTKIDNKPAKITSILGSSAGGIVALAISTGIQPYQLSNLCSKMRTIPVVDRIDQNYCIKKIKDQISAQQKKAIIAKRKQEILGYIKNILTQYGIVQNSLFQTFQKINLDEKKLNKVKNNIYKFLFEVIGSISQTLDFTNNQFNLLGLLLQGALMSGQFINSLACQCLIKFLLRCDQDLIDLTYEHVIKKPKQVKECIIKFDRLCSDILKIPLAKFYSQELLSIINNAFTIINRLIRKSHNNNQSHKSIILDKKFAQVFFENFEIKNTKVYPSQQLQKIIFDHNQLKQLDKKQLKDAIKQKRGILVKQILHKSQKISYDQITSILSQEFFLDRSLYSLKKDNILTLQNFLIKLFQSSFNINEIINEKTFKREVVQVIIQNASSTLKANEKCLSEYQQNYNILKEHAARITLKEFYKMTKIELTCTSVDLDSQILRFLNHKTSPLLPVCYAVQMTGSFPVGFKAQKWQNNWGNYLVHYPDVRRQVFVQQHEFTDGGMLANFPIKYFDNEQLRDEYFSHVTNKSRPNKVHPYETIMLGFGLDNITPETYTPNEQQMEQIIKKKDSLSKIKTDLFDSIKDLASFTGSWPKMKAGLKFKGVLFQILNAKGDSIPWGMMNHELLNKVPLFKFAKKLITAYPRADRNLNLQCFKDSILVTKLLPQHKEHQISNQHLKLRLLNSLRNVEFDGKGWDYWKDILGFKKKIIQDASNITNSISESIKKTPLYKILFDQRKSYNLLKDLFEQIGKKKQSSLKSIKDLMIKVISSRMKLQQPTLIEAHTLKFLLLRYGKYPQNESMNKAIDIVFNNKLQNQISTGHKDIIKQNLILVDEKVIDSKQIMKNTKILDKKQYLNLDNFILTEHERFLIQYIFLSKYKDRLQIANNIIKSTSVQTFLDGKEKNHSYITLKDLKEFYKHIESNNKYIPQYSKSNYEDLLSKDDQIVWDQFNQKDLLQKWQIYINPQIGLTQLKKNFINKIHFGTILHEVFPDKNFVQKIQDSLFQLVSKNPEKYISQLANILFESKGKIMNVDSFRQHLNKQSTRKYLIKYLFSRQNKFYNDNEYIKQQYQRQQEAIRQRKKLIIEQINDQMIKNKKKAGNSSFSSLKYHLLDILHEINQQILIQKLQSGKKLTFNLKDEHLSKELLTHQTTKSDLDNRLAIRQSLKLQEKQKENEYQQMIKHAKDYSQDLSKFEIYLHTIGVQLYRFSNIETPISDLCKHVAIQIVQNLIGIKQWLIGQLSKIIQRPIGSIALNHINEVYNLDYIGVKNISKSLFQAINKLKQFKEGNQYSTSVKNLLQIIENLYHYLNNYQFRLPHFQIVWRLYKKQFGNQYYSKAFEQILNKQLTPQFIYKWSNSYSKESKDNKPKQLKVHLILQGLDMSNEYYAYYYELLQDFIGRKPIQNAYSLRANNKIQKQELLKPYQIKQYLSILTIRAVTTSSYHSIFGLLLCLGYSTCELKNQMSRIRQIALQLQNKKLLEQYYNSKKWGYKSSQDLAEYWKYLKMQNRNIFAQLQVLANKSLKDYSLVQEFQKIKELYKHQQDKIMKYCQQILEEITSQIHIIDGKVNPKFQAREICKKYGYNYTCDLKNQHQYKTANQRSLAIYLQIIKRLMNAYGSLLEGVIMNLCSKAAKLKLQPKHSQLIFKGFVVEQLLSTYKIKNYVIQKLRQNFLEENITLLEFFHQAPVKLLLNFTTVNVNEQRLEFMNKNTLPNMPVWAAVVSASCLPYFYKNFQSPNDWSHPIYYFDNQYQRIIDNFFSSHPLSSSMVKYSSGNSISSFPLEILTNQTAHEKMFVFEADQPYLKIGFAFNAQDKDYLNTTIQLKRNYISASFIDAVKTWKNMPGQSQFRKNCTELQNGDFPQTHKTKAYKQISGVINKLFSSNKNNAIVNVLTIQASCNDNFILHTYHDKLVKLPIKINTLQFTQSMNQEFKRKYGADIPSNKVKETIQRSQYITKYFQMKQLKNQQQRFEIKLRVQIILQESAIYGQNSLFAKIDLLSHSKWNHNHFNHFVVGYSDSPSDFKKTQKFATNSQILWNLNQSQLVYLRFYYQQSRQQIIYSQFQVNIEDLINELPLKNSYDYSFNFGQPVLKAYDPQICYDEVSHPLVSFRKNRIEICSPKSPKLKIRRWFNPNEKRGAHYINPNFG